MTKSQTTSTYDRILDEAEGLFHLKGYNYTSISDLVEATGVQKGTIYHHFGGKHELAICVMQRAKERFFAFVRRSLAGETPRKRLYSFLDAALKKHRDENFVGGCLFGNTALEASDTDPELAGVVREVFDGWAELLVAEIKQGQECGQFRDDLSAETLARHVIAVLEGGIMQGRLRKDVNPFATNIECLKIFLE